MKKLPRSRIMKPGKWVQITLVPYKNYFVCCSCGRTHKHFYDIGRNKKGEPLLFVAVLDDDAVTNHQREKMLREHRLHTLNNHFMAFLPKRRKRR